MSEEEREHGGSPEARDPWVLGGLALLALLSLGAILLYRSAPQSLEEARTRTWVAAQPDAFSPQLRRAEERLRAAADAREAGSDSAAVVALAAAAEHARAARDLAREDTVRTAAATEVWAEAMLQRAELLLQLGTGRGLRRDDNATLSEALSLTEQVLAVPVRPATRERAEELRTAIARRLRFGPLEWLPLPR